MRPTLTLGLLLLTATSCQDPLSTAPAPTPEPSRGDPVRTSETHDERYAEERFHRAHDMFISADRPRVVSAEKANFLEDEDEVLGFVLDGQARCYDVRALCYHHVINDLIGATPIAVTY